MHKHIFIHTGGGMAFSGDMTKNCDDEYTCVCGEQFIVYTNSVGHRYLPEVIESAEMSEVKKAEQDAITDVTINNIHPLKGTTTS